MQQVWQQQASEAASAASAQVRQALQQHMQAQHSSSKELCGEQQQQGLDGGGEEAPVRQLQRLMRQHKQELVLQVGLI